MKLAIRTAQAYVVCMVCYVTSKLHQMLESCCLGDDILMAAQDDGSIEGDASTGTHAATDEYCFQFSGRKA